MLDPVPASPSPLCRRLRVLACLSMLGLGASPASALPPLEPAPAPGPLLAQGEPSGSEQPAQEDRQAPFDALNQVLEETRAKLEELTAAAATVAADTKLRNELQTLKRDNERLATELAQANARRIELERSSELAQARVAELTEAVEEAVRKAARVDEALAGQVRRNQQLDESLARAETAREAAVAEAEKTRAEMAKTLEAATDEAAQSKAELASLREQFEAATNEAAQSKAELASLREELEAATDEAAQSKAELASFREQFEANLQELATAKSAREEVGAWASKLEEVVERSGVEVERVKAELAAVKGQLGQAAGAAVEAERARQAMSEQAESLRSDAARARDELSAANTEIARLKATNAELDKEIASWRTSSTSAIETARQNLVMMEEKIEELNTALALGQPAGAAPAPDPQAKPAPVEDERATATEAPSAMAQPSAPEPAGKTGAGQPADSPIERSETELSMVGPTAAPAEADPRLERFRADIQSLNDLVLSAAGGDLFSGIESVSGRTVDVGATVAWDALPEVGKKSYLESLLDRWVAAQGGQGPAVVRIVDPSGRVLGEKSWP
jgi:chromosome segregation ATPase